MWRMQVRVKAVRIQRRAKKKFLGTFLSIARKAMRITTRALNNSQCQTLKSATLLKHVKKLVTWQLSSHSTETKVLTVAIF
jgi:hypothetical protein